MTLLSAQDINLSLMEGWIENLWIENSWASGLKIESGQWEHFQNAGIRTEPVAWWALAGRHRAGAMGCAVSIAAQRALMAATYGWKYGGVGFQFNLLELRSWFQVHGIRLRRQTEQESLTASKKPSDMSFRVIIVRKTGISHCNCINTNMFSVI